MSRQPSGPPPPPVVQRLRIRYAKRDRMRFTSHRDFARAFERALRRARVPMAYSAGFSPHPKVSYAGAAPTGVASEAEYLEIGVAQRCDPERVRAALDTALPPGLDVVKVVEAVPGQPALGELTTASHWRVELPDVPVTDARAALDLLLALESVTVDRPTKDGHRSVDARAALLVGVVVPVDDTGAPDAAEPAPTSGYATIEMVVRHLTPAVRPDDVLTALREAAHLTTPVTPRVTRLAQGMVDERSATDEMRLLDPLTPISDRPPISVDHVAAAAPS